MPQLQNVLSQLGHQPLVKGKKVTGFTNTEEELVKLTDVVPFLVEDMLKENGGIYSKVGDFEPYALEDGLLITGQNPASSEKVAEILLEKLPKYATFALDTKVFTKGELRRTRFLCTEVDTGKQYLIYKLATVEHITE